MAKNIDEDDFKRALGNWYWALDEMLDWDNKEFKEMLNKYGYTLEEVIKASIN